jgi:hypothetical protein
MNDRVPAKSPMFGADRVSNGCIDAVVRNTAVWIEAQNLCLCCPGHHANFLTRYPPVESYGS